MSNLAGSDLSNKPYQGVYCTNNLRVIDRVEISMTPTGNEDERHAFLEPDEKSKEIQSIAHRGRTYWKALAILLLTSLAFQTSVFMIWISGNQVKGSYSKGFTTDLGISLLSQLNLVEISDFVQTTSNPPSGSSSVLLVVRYVLTEMERCFSTKTQTSPGLSTLRLRRPMKIGKI